MTRKPSLDEIYILDCKVKVTTWKQKHCKVKVTTWKQKHKFAISYYNFYNTIINYRKSHYYYLLASNLTKKA